MSDNRQCCCFFTFCQLIFPLKLPHLPFHKYCLSTCFNVANWLPTSCGTGAARVYLLQSWIFHHWPAFPSTAVCADVAESRRTASARRPGEPSFNSHDTPAPGWSALEQDIKIPSSSGGAALWGFDRSRAPPAGEERVSELVLSTVTLFNF